MSHPIGRPNSEFSKKIGIQFLFFSAMGAIGTLVHYSVLIICIHKFSVSPVLSSGIGCVSGAITNYLLNYHFTFHSSKNHTEAAVKFFTVALIGLLINLAIFDFFLEKAKWNYLCAQMMATGIVLIWTFLGNKIWTFRAGGRVNE